jgi:hypothetical protein
MPLYKFICDCGVKEHYKPLIERDTSFKCNKCGHEKKRIFHAGGNISVFKPYWNPHIDPAGPIWIESKRQLFEETKKRGCVAKYCEDSFNRKI